MFAKFNEQVQGVLLHANEEAKLLNHTYIGTEHLLLALARTNSGVAASVLNSFGISEAAVRQETARLVQRGVDDVSTRLLPLTPRAKLAIAFAEEQARYLNFRQIAPEHILIGLIREPDGVAGQVLRNLGLKPESLHEEVVRIRVEQLKLVERAVRSVRATTAKKMKMREELLAHFMAIYDEELAELHDPQAAFTAAGERFGDPAELADELSWSLPMPERIGYFVERWLGWHAPESAFRYVARSAVVSLVILASICAVPAVIGLIGGWNLNEWNSLRPAATSMLFVPLSQFLIGLCYFKLRDCLFGVFGTRRSWARVVALDTLIGGLVLAIELGYLTLSTGTFATAENLFLPLCLGAVAGAIFILTRAIQNGPAEIAHTVWDLSTWPPQQNESPSSRRPSHDRYSRFKFALGGS